MPDERKCLVCGAPGFVGHTYFTENWGTHVEWQCRYCFIWSAAATLQSGGPTWGRRQAAPLRWLERALDIDWPEAPLLRLLREINSDTGDEEIVFKWLEKNPERD